MAAEPALPLRAGGARQSAAPTGRAAAAAGERWAAQAASSSRRDALTGLADRAGFISQAAALKRLQRPLSLLSIDIERFTAINSEIGLDGGDELLRELAARCVAAAAAAGATCVAGRVGADEIALALAPPASAAVNGAAAAWHASARTGLQQALGRPSATAAMAGRVVAVSIGHAALGPDDDVAVVLQHAVSARADGGHAGLHCYEAQQDERKLTASLREAIAAGDIGIALQPKVRLASGELAGFEALARWAPPDGEDVPPARFVALAERHGLVEALGERVLTRVLTLLRSWIDRGLPAVPVAVNFSAPQVHRADAAARVAALLTRFDIPARLLELEITESMLLSDVPAAIRTLQSLRALGVRLSIDDFGTGYSSLAYLRRFPVHELKIDRGFVAEMTHDADGAEIVQLLVQLARRLRLDCVAEGVETRAQLERLRVMGCDQAQGWLLARPGSAHQVEPALGGVPPWRHLFGGG